MVEPISCRKPRVNFTGDNNFKGVNAVTAASEMPVSDVRGSYANTVKAVSDTKTKFMASADVAQNLDIKG